MKLFYFFSLFLIFLKQGFTNGQNELRLLRPLVFFFIFETDKTDGKLDDIYKEFMNELSTRTERKDNFFTVFFCTPDGSYIPIDAANGLYIFQDALNIDQYNVKKISDKKNFMDFFASYNYKSGGPDTLFIFFTNKINYKMEIWLPVFKNIRNRRADMIFVGDYAEEYNKKYMLNCDKNEICKNWFKYTPKKDNLIETVNKLVDKINSHKGEDAICYIEKGKCDKECGESFTLISLKTANWAYSFNNYTGVKCPEASLYEKCKVPSCEDPCFSKWSDWGKCEETSNNTQTRVRLVLFNKTPYLCTKNTRETRNCQIINNNSNETNEPKSSSMTTMSMVSVIVGCLVAAGGLFGGIFYYKKPKNEKHDDDDDTSQDL